MTRTKNKKEGFIRSSGNVFEDMGLPDSEELLVKANLVSLINNAIQEQGWTQKQAAKELGTTQPKISGLSQGQIDNFSVEKLMSFLTDLDHVVTIVVQKAKQKESKIVVPKRQKSLETKEARI